MSENFPPEPTWFRVDPWEWTVTIITRGGAEVTHFVRKTRFSDRGRLQWYVLKDGLDPVWLASNIGDAKDEYLLLYVHGWRRPFGFVDGDATRPVYGKGQQRRERAEVLAEIKAKYRAQRKERQR